jgi:chromobox protein 5
MVDQAKSPEVIADSEEEQELKSKENVSTVKDADATAPNNENGGENESGEEDEEGDGGEYEIEAILDAKHGSFPEVCASVSV